MNAFLRKDEAHLIDHILDCSGDLRGKRIFRIFFRLDRFFGCFVEIIGFVPTDDNMFYLFESLMLLDHFLMMWAALLMISGFDELGHLFVSFVDSAGVDIFEEIFVFSDEGQIFHVFLLIPFYVGLFFTIWNQLFTRSNLNLQLILHFNFTSVLIWILHFLILHANSILFSSLLGWVFSEGRTQPIFQMFVSIFHHISIPKLSFRWEIFLGSFKDYASVSKLRLSRSLLGMKGVHLTHRFKLIYQHDRNEIFRFCRWHEGLWEGDVESLKNVFKVRFNGHSRQLYLNKQRIEANDKCK